MSGFGVENLPYGVVARPGGPPRVAVRIGDRAAVLETLADAGLIDLPREVAAAPVLNPLMALGPAAWRALRARLRELLGGEEPRGAVERALVPLSEVEQRLPVAVGDYVDFYSSLE